MDAGVDVEMLLGLVRMIWKAEPVGTRRKGMRYWQRGRNDLEPVMQNGATVQQSMIRHTTPLSG